MAEKTFHSLTLPGQDTARVPLTAAEFNTSTAYTVKDYCTYQGKLYRCTVAHTAGAWNASHFIETDMDAELDRKLDIPPSQANAPANPRVGDLWIDNDENSPIYNVDASPTLNSTNAVQSGGTKIALNSLDSRKMEHGVITGDFSASVDYRIGDLVFYATTANGITTRTLYRCTTDHNAAAWNAAHFTATTLEVELQKIRESEADTDMIGDLFGAKSTYAIGDYCVYNDNLYRCIRAVDNSSTSTPAFDPNDWTQVKLANDVNNLNNTITEKYGYNLLPQSKHNTTVNNVIVNYSSGIVTLAGTATASGGRLVPITDLFTLTPGRYTLSLYNGATTLFIESGNTILAQINSFSGSTTFTLDTEKIVYIGLNVDQNNIYDTTCYIQLEQGSSSSSWKEANVSAIDRYLRDTFVTPEMFGAKGNGIDADGEALQAAFNSGKRVKLSGIYNVKSSKPYSEGAYLFFPDNLILEGGTLKFPDNGNESQQRTGINLAVGNHFTIRNCTFDMNGYNNIPTPTKTMYAIFIDNCNEVLIENCNFKDSAGRDYIFVKQGKKFTIKNCTFKNGGTNIAGSDLIKQDDFSYVYTSADYSIVDGCIIYEPDADPFTYCGGFEMHGDNSVIQNCIINKCLPGIYVARHHAHERPNKNIRILNNTLLNCQGGISLFDNHTIIDCMITGNNITLSPVTPVEAGMYGIGSGRNNLLKAINIKDNIISQSENSQYGSSGISFAKTDGIIVSNNFISNVDYPISINGSNPQENIIIKENSIISDNIKTTYAINKESIYSTINRLLLKDNYYKNYTSLFNSTSNITNLTIFDSSKIIEFSKNLMPAGHMEVTDRGVTSIYEDGKITLSGIATGTIGRLTPRSPYFTLPQGTYTFSTTDILEQIFIESGSNIVATLASTSRKVTFTLPEQTTLYFAINVKPESDNTFSFMVQIENGRDATQIKPVNWYSAIDYIARE